MVSPLRSRGQGGHRVAGVSVRVETESSLRIWAFAAGMPVPAVNLASFVDGASGAGRVE